MTEHQVRFSVPFGGDILRTMSLVGQLRLDYPKLIPVSVDHRLRHFPRYLLRLSIRAEVIRYLSLAPEGLSPSSPAF